MHFYYDIDEWELFDLQEDPHEMKNLYGDPAYAKVQADLYRQLEELRAKYHDSDEQNQKFIDEYNEKVKENPRIEYWKFSAPAIQAPRPVPQPVEQ